MRVRDVMTREVQCMRPESTIQEAAQRMRDMDVGALPICDNDRLTGMITDRDIVIRIVCEGHDPATDHVVDAMTERIVYCFEDQDVSEAARLMRDKQIRRLAVLNREKRLVGIVSLGDLAVQTGDDEMAGHALEGISEPAMHS